MLKNSLLLIALVGLISACSQSAAPTQQKAFVRSPAQQLAHEQDRADHLAWLEQKYTLAE